MPLPSPTPSPAAPIVVASLAQLAELEATGRAVLCSHSYAQLTAVAWKLHAALYSLQCDAVQGADGVDLSAAEDMACLFERLRDEQGRA
jgi:hypothetical protein